MSSHNSDSEHSDSESGDESQNYYDAIAVGYDNLHKQEQRRKLKLILNHFQYDNNEFLLDVELTLRALISIGGGSGVSVEFFKCTIFGLDPARELLRLNKSNVVHARGESLPFRDQSIDIILCLTALHNFSDPFKGLEEMRRVCRDRFIITVLKKSVNAERTEAICKAIKTMFKVEKELDDLHDYIYLCRHLDKQ